MKIRDLALWDTAHSRAAVSGGTYRFMVGSDASSIVGALDVQVTGSLTPKVQYVTVQPAGSARRLQLPHQVPGGRAAAVRG